MLGLVATENKNECVVKKLEERDALTSAKSHHCLHQCVLPFDRVSYLQLDVYDDGGQPSGHVLSYLGLSLMRTQYWRRVCCCADPLSGITFSPALHWQFCTYQRYNWPCPVGTFFCTVLAFAVVLTCTLCRNTLDISALGVCIRKGCCLWSLWFHHLLFDSDPGLIRIQDNISSLFFLKLHACFSILGLTCVEVSFVS